MIPNYDSAPHKLRQKWQDTLRQDGLLSFVRAILRESYYVTEAQLQPMLHLIAEVARAEAAGDMREAVRIRQDGVTALRQEREALELVRLRVEWARTASPADAARVSAEAQERLRQQERARRIPERVCEILAEQDRERRRAATAQAEAEFSETWPAHVEPQSAPRAQAAKGRAA